MSLADHNSGEDPRVILITGIMAAGKSTVAQHLAERLPRSVHLRGDVFRRMIVGGRAEMAAAQLWGAAGQLPGGRRIVRALRRSFDLATEIQDWGDRSDGALS